MAMGPGGATRVSLSSLATVLEVVTASVVVAEPTVAAGPPVVVVSEPDDPHPAIRARQAADPQTIRVINVEDMDPEEGAWRRREADREIRYAEDYERRR
ncbi:MAG: hypothetical protein ABH877_00165, partial [bacterium]